LGQALSRQGLYNLAISEYQRALDLDPSLHLMHLYLARAYAQAGRHGDAINSFRKLASRLGVLEETRLMGEAYVEMGHSYLASNQPVRAAEVFQAALQRNPRDAGSLHGLACVALARRNLPKARDTVNQALMLEPRNADFLCTLAEICGEEGRWADAVEVLKKARDFAPKRPEIYEKLGRSQRKAQRPADAVETFRQAAENFPRKAPSFMWMEGRVEAREGNWGQAALLFGRAVELNPNDWNIYRDLCQACHRIGEIPRAIENLQQAIRLAPSREQAGLQKYLELLEQELAAR
ncbi:MAG: tetratricopeptide repeat protein, partial [Candidatus Eremiobacterota bacterium]